MGTIESLISRYLDGELTATEQHELRRLLAESPDARALFREMSAVAGAARRMPLLHRPAPSLERTLFQRLQAEGLYSDAPRNAGMQRSRGISKGSRQMALAGAALLLLLIGILPWLGGNNEMARAPIASLPNSATLSSGFDRGASIAIPPVVLESRIAEGEREAGVTDRSSRLPRRNAIASRSVVPSRRNASTSHASLPDASIPNIPMEKSPEAIGDDGRDEVRSLASAIQLDTSVPSNMPELPRENAAHNPVNPPAPQLFADMHGGKENEWIASLRGGLATVDGMEGKMVREFDVKIGIEIDGGHQVAFIGGLASSLAETRNERTDIAFSAPAMSIPGQNSSGRSNDVASAADADGPAEFEREFQSEPWFGVGYNYSLALLKDVSIDPGVKAGAGASTWRVGLEVPVRLKVSEKMSLECAMSVAHVLPRDGDVDRFQVTDTPNRFVYEGEKSYPSFTTYGIQVGVRLELAAP